MMMKFASAIAALSILLFCTPASAAEPPPLSAYGKLPGFEDAAISPSGRHIAVVATIKGKRLLVLLDSKMAVQNSDAVGDVKVRGLRWIGDDSVLLTTSDTQKLDPEFVADKYEAVRAMIVPAKPGGNVEMVFTREGAIVDSVFGEYGVRKVGGKWIGYFGGIALAHSDVGRFLDNARPALFAVALAKNTAKKISNSANGGFWRDWRVGANGRIAATFTMNSRSGEWRISGPTGKDIARGTNPAGSADLVAIGEDKKSIIYWADDHGDGTEHWYEVPLDGSAAPVEFLKDTLVDKIYLSPVDGHMIGYLRKGGQPGRVFFDPKLQQLSNKIDKAFPGLHTELEDWTPGFGKVLVFTSGTGDSGSWYVVNLATLRADLIGMARPLITSKHVGPVSRFSYKAADGVDLDGVLTLPPGREAKDLPVILLPHGGPRAFDKVQFDWWAQAFASRGYAVFQPNFRGSTNRGSDFMHAGDGQWGRKMQTDISDGLMALAAKGIVDPSRACIMGGSYGGYAALAGVTLQHGVYRCAVSIAGVSDVKSMYLTNYREGGQSSVERRALLEELGPLKNLDEISPRKHAADADAPILLIHGRDDTVVPFQQSVKMADALKDAGKTYKFVELEGEDHWLSRSKTRDQMLEAAVAFVRKYDPPS